MFFIKFTFRDAGAATRGVLQEKMFIEILQNSLENTCARVFFFIMLQASACKFVKTDSGTGAFLSILQNF